MLLAENKKALFDYEILEKLEAGLVLLGYEVKAAKTRQIQLKSSFVTFHDNQAFITNMHISRYKPAGKSLEYDPTRSRKILLRKKQIRHLQGKALEKGLTIVPLRVYTNGRLIKVEVAVARGRKTFDKRELLKKREVQREMEKIRKL